MKDDLIKLGFSSHEADVYLALLDSGQTSAGEIIKKTSLHRNIVYETLDRLISKKLVIKVIKKKIAHFQITDPKRIEQNAKARVSLVETIMPELTSRAKIKNEIVVYDGVEGFRTFGFSCLEQLSNGETIYVLGAAGDRWYELMGDDYKKYDKIRRKKKIIWKTISYNLSELDKKVAKEIGTLSQTRVVSESFETPANVLIFGDKIALQTMVEPISVIEIKNAALVQAYLNYFKMLWDQGGDLL